MGNKNTVKSWNENDIRLYLSEEFPDAGQDLVARVTQAVNSEGKEKLLSVLSSYRQNHNFNRFSNFKNIDHDSQLMVSSMIEGIHRRFVGGTYDSMSST